VATEAQAPEELVERVQDLLGSLDEIADPFAQQRVQELIGAVLELYGAGLDRILGVVTDAGEAGLKAQSIGRQVRGKESKYDKEKITKEVQIEEKESIKREKKWNGNTYKLDTYRGKMKISIKIDSKIGKTLTPLGS